MNGGAILGPVALAQRATAAPCPGCYVVDEIRRAISLGAVAKAATLRKSPAVRAVKVHKCGRGQA
jgi:hypothetical protein